MTDSELPQDASQEEEQPRPLSGKEQKQARASARDLARAEEAARIVASHGRDSDAFLANLATMDKRLARGAVQQVLKGEAALRVARGEAPAAELRQGLSGLRVEAWDAIVDTARDSTDATVGRAWRASEGFRGACADISRGAWDATQGVRDAGGWLALKGLKTGAFLILTPVGFVEETVAAGVHGTRAMGRELRADIGTFSNGIRGWTDRNIIQPLAARSTRRLSEVRGEIANNNARASELRGKQASMGIARKAMAAVNPVR